MQTVNSTIAIRQHHNPRDEFARAMAEGYRVFRARDYSRAHRIWRHAAMLEPANEQVWLALLEVLISDADRKVCLENILAINPYNLQAQRMLLQYSQIAPESEADSQPSRVLGRKPSPVETFMLLFGAMVAGVVMALFLYWLVFDVLQFELEPFIEELRSNLLNIF